MALLPHLWRLIPEDVPSIPALTCDASGFGAPPAAPGASARIAWADLRRLFVLVRDRGPLSGSATWLAIGAGSGLAWVGTVPGLHSFIEELQARPGFDAGAWIESAGHLRQGVFVLFSHPSIPRSPSHASSSSGASLETLFELHDRFESLMKRLAPAAPRASAFSTLFTGWSEPHRHAHTVDHLMRCLDILDAHVPNQAHKDTIEYALWYHRLIYNTLWGDNERRGAREAERALQSAGLPALGRQVSTMILASSRPSSPPAGETAVLVDIGRSILGAPRDEFIAFERGLRMEYRWVPGWMYVKRRRRYFQELLDKPTIFLTPEFQATFERKARENLRRDDATPATPSRDGGSRGTKT